MSVNFNETPADSVLNAPSDTPMFGPTPVWERNGKRRGRGRPVTAAKESAAERVDQAYAAPERATFAEPAAPVTMAAEPMSAPADGRLLNPEFPTSRASTSQSKRATKSGASPIAIAAGVVVIAGLGAAGFYAMQPREQGVAQLTPGSTAVATAPAPAPLVADTAAPMPEAPVEVASNEAAPAPAPVRPATRRSAPVAAASAMSADQASADVSATEVDAGQAGALDTVDYGMDPAPAAEASAAAAPAAPAEIIAPETAPMTIPAP